MPSAAERLGSTDRARQADALGRAAWKAAGRGEGVLVQRRNGDGCDYLFVRLGMAAPVLDPSPEVAAASAGAGSRAHLSCRFPNG